MMVHLLLIYDCWLCQLAFLCPQAHTPNIPCILTSFVLLPKDNTQCTSQDQNAGG